MQNKSLSSQRKLIKRIKGDRSKSDSLIQLLEMKKKKPITLNPKIIKDKTKFDKSENKVALEGVKIIQESNNTFVKNINNYNERKENNEFFTNKFKKYKSLANKDKIEVIEKNKLIFGNLLRAYEDKGINFGGNFFHKGIYNVSGILLRKKKLIEDYYANEVKKEGNKSRKIIKYKNFLNKLSTQVKDKLMKKNPIQSKNKTQKEEKNKYHKITDFEIGQIHECIKKKKEIKKLISENNLLKKLIDIDRTNFQIKKDEKDVYKKSKEEDNKKILIYTNNNSENYISLDNESEDNDELKDISTIRKKRNKDGEKNLVDRTNHNKLMFRTIFNENNNKLSKAFLLKKEDNPKSNRSLPQIEITRNKVKKTVSFNNTNVTSANIRSIESSLFKTRLKSKIKEKNSKIFPSLDKIKNKRKSNVEMLKKIYTLNNSDRTIMKDKTSNSQSNFSSVEDTYEKLIKYDVKSKYNKVHKILENFYGDQIKEIGGKINGLKLLNFLYKIRGRTIQNEIKDVIYSKYRDLLPDEFEKKINIDKNLNEKLKNLGAYFIHNYCQSLNKLNQSE